MNGVQRRYLPRVGDRGVDLDTGAHLTPNVGLRFGSCPLASPDRVP